MAELSPPHPQAPEPPFASEANITFASGLLSFLIFIYAFFVSSYDNLSFLHLVILCCLCCVALIAVGIDAFSTRTWLLSSVFVHIFLTILKHATGAVDEVNYFYGWVYLIVTSIFGYLATRPLYFSSLTISCACVIHSVHIFPYFFSRASSPQTNKITREFWLSCIMLSLLSLVMSCKILPLRHQARRYLPDAVAILSLCALRIYSVYFSEENVTTIFAHEAIVCVPFVVMRITLRTVAHIANNDVAPTDNDFVAVKSTDSDSEPEEPVTKPENDRDLLLLTDNAVWQSYNAIHVAYMQNSGMLSAGYIGILGISLGFYRALTYFGVQGTGKDFVVIGMVIRFTLAFAVFLPEFAFIYLFFRNLGAAECMLRCTKEWKIFDDSTLHCCKEFLTKDIAPLNSYDFVGKTIVLFVCVTLGPWLLYKELFPAT